MFDTVLLQETWIEREKEKTWLKKLSKIFKRAAQAAQRTKTKGRAKGGMIGIKKGLNVGKLKSKNIGIKEHSEGLATSEG